MKNFEEFLYKYGLHDCKIDNISLFDEGAIFFLNSGIYNLDSNGKETNKTSNCKMSIFIKNFNPLQIWEHIEIYKIMGERIVEVDYSDFADDIKQNKLDIDMQYYSNFCNTVLLNGFIGKNKYCIKISEVYYVNFEF